jgi:hypothetical protein
MKIDVVKEIQDIISNTMLKPDGPLCVDVKVPYPPIWGNFTALMQQKSDEWERHKIIEQVTINDDVVSITLKQDTATNNFRRIYSTRNLFENFCRLRVLKLKSKQQKTEQQD